jgi:hypothetical protein
MPCPSRRTDECNLECKVRSRIFQVTKYECRVTNEKFMVYEGRVRWNQSPEASVQQTSPRANEPLHVPSYLHVSKKSKRRLEVFNFFILGNITDSGSEAGMTHLFWDEPTSHELTSHEQTSPNLSPPTPYNPINQNSKF